MKKIFVVSFRGFNGCNSLAIYLVDICSFAMLRPLYILNETKKKPIYCLKIHRHFHLVSPSWIKDLYIHKCIKQV